MTVWISRRPDADIDADLAASRAAGGALAGVRLAVKDNVDAAGLPTYVEHHRTLGDRVRDVVAAGLVLDDLVEPEWPEGRDTVWGQWSPLRGALFPGTAIFVCRLPRP